MIVKEDIPPGIINELKSIYADIDYSNYDGILTEDVQTKRVAHKELISSESLMMYVIRGVITDDNILKLYAVLEAGLVRNT